jgi:uncharacterized membrane protein
MNVTFKKELPIIGIVLMPFVYLAFIWNTLPDKIPTHWNVKGEIDQWGDKFSLIGVLFMLPVFVYVLMLVIPKIDPKKKISLMGGKYQQLKFVLVLFMSALAIVILYITKDQSISSPSLICLPIGLLFIGLGNYFKVIQPNYFIGIKTPWTLENKEVWKLTHILAGKLWVLGGLTILVSTLMLPDTIIHTVILTIVAIICIIPIAFSYLKFKELEKKK